MDRPLLAGGVVTGGLALVAWTQIARPAIAPCGLAAGVIIGLATPGTNTGFLRGAKAGLLGAVAFVGTVTLVGAVRYRLVSVGFAIDWALFTGFSMSIMVLPLFAIEGAVAAPATNWFVRRVASRNDVDRSP